MRCLLIAILAGVGLAVSPAAASADLPTLRIQAARAIPNEPKVAARLRMPGYLSRKRARAIADRVRAAERALYRRGNWRRHIDEASAVDFVLLNELFKN